MNIYEGLAEKMVICVQRKLGLHFFLLSAKNESDALQFYDTISGRASVQSVQGTFHVWNYISHKKYEI